MTTDQQRRRRSNGVALGIVGAAVVAATLLTTSNALSSPPTRATTTAAAPAAQPAPKPNPQPTKTTTIKGKAALAIKTDLSATVTAVAAVQGKAQGPGEIAGPAVQFTIAITNETGKPFDLANTVVNAYYGTSATPATPLEQEAGRPFPKKLKDGATATGVFVFTIPKDQRSTVLVTVDTSVHTPVVAFRGSAPA
jgi:hypothetical protein